MAVSSETTFPFSLRSRFRYVHVYVDIHALVHFHFHCDDGVLLIKAQIFVCIVFVPFARLFGFSPSTPFFLLRCWLPLGLRTASHAARGTSYNRNIIFIFTTVVNFSWVKQIQQIRRLLELVLTCALFHCICRTYMYMYKWLCVCGWRFLFWHVKALPKRETGSFSAGLPDCAERTRPTFGYKLNIYQTRINCLRLCQKNFKKFSMH